MPILHAYLPFSSLFSLQRGGHLILWNKIKTSSLLHLCWWKSFFLVAFNLNTCSSLTLSFLISFLLLVSVWLVFSMVGWKREPLLEITSLLFFSWICLSYLFLLLLLNHTHPNCTGGNIICCKNDLSHWFSFVSLEQFYIDYISLICNKNIAGRNWTNFKQLLICKHIIPWLFRASLGLCSCEPTPKSYSLSNSAYGHILRCYESRQHHSALYSPRCSGFLIGFPK